MNIKELKIFYLAQDCCSSKVNLSGKDITLEWTPT